MQTLIAHPQAWLALATVLLLAEVLTTTFFLACLALGALAAAGLAAFGRPGLECLGAFSGAGILALFTLRPLLLRLLRPSRATPTNTAALVGQMGRVTVSFDPAKDEGRVQVAGEDWWACTNPAEALQEGQAVIVRLVEGSRLVVEATNHQSGTQPSQDQPQPSTQP